ncbi:heparinase [Paenibacillus sp. LMG 31458]|uniref:Heparinase n=1 Tax=Paenibacillus phytorum TaxID=2654977 RepID=A0ABX1Y476_9BACL|nr:heparinase II/III family protein [Paenibacillus phytorum]NOU74768.1 heparinase [Paenibacillus phytorum]
MNMLTERYANDISRVITTYENYNPYPKAHDRAIWESIPDTIRNFWISKGEAYLSFSCPALTAVDYMEYSRNGNVMRFQSKFEERRIALASLVLAECMEGAGRFIDQIMNGIWTICEETSWVTPPHMVISKASSSDCIPNISDQYIDLFAGETASLMATTHYLLQKPLDAVSPNICGRIRLEMKRRIFDPYLERSDLWWMGLETNRKMNNWNPWINSNCISAFLLMEKNDERRYLAIEKIMRTLDRYIGDCSTDGGCDEGPVYWDRAGGALFDCLEQLYQASLGKINLYDEPLIQEIGRYLYRVHIADNYFANFADSSGKFEIEATTAYRYGSRIGDRNLMRLASSAYQTNKPPLSRWLTLHRVIPTLFLDEQITENKKTPPYVHDVWMNSIEVMTAREQEGSSHGLYLAVKGGHNDESHNHNDIGHFLVYSDGKPFLIDVGVGTYTAKTFSTERYDIWTMQSAYHNVPLVNGIQQKADIAYKASEVHYQVHHEAAQISMNLTSAYPETAGIDSWKRTYSLYRGQESYIEIVDDFELIQATDDIIVHLMTPCMPLINSNGSILLQNPGGEKVYIHYDGSNLLAASEAIKLTDERLQAAWGDCLYRIILKAKQAVSAAVWTLRICKG